MMFRVLGPVEVKIGDRWLSPGPPKQRALLATVLLSRGRVAPIESIVEVLWGQSPPTSAAKNIQMYVWRLRKLLGDRLCFRQPGYVLDVGPGELDADMFDAQVSLAVQARTAGNLRTASGALTAALGLWQGPALADLVAAGLAAELARPLDAQRLRAIHDLVDVDFGLARQEELLPQLAAWVADFPLDEPLRERQMAALLQVGRAAEALSVYRDADATLLARLGTRAGPALVSLAATARQASTSHSSSTLDEPIRQLPPASTMFVGRRGELSRICDLLAPRVVSVPVVTVAGPGGVGKSALAIRAGHQLADAFVDGQLYLDLQGAYPGLAPMAVDEALRRLLRSLDIDPAKVPAELTDAIGMYRNRVAGQRLLVVLDNAANPAQVRPLIPGSGGCAVLITSRRTMSELDGSTQVHLQTLPDQDAIELFKQVAGTDRIIGEPGEAVAQVVNACAGLPLALRLAGARLATRPSWTLQSLNRRLRDERQRLNELQAGDLAVRSSFRVSYESLSPRLRLLFRCCGLFPGPDFGARAIAVLINSDRGEIEEGLENLVEAALLQTARPGRFHLHDLIRIYAAERATQEDDGSFRQQGLARLAEWYLHAADVADRLIAPARGRPIISASGPGVAGVTLSSREQALDWFEAERANLSAIIHTAAELGLHRVAWQIPVVMRGYMKFHQYTKEWIDVHRVALASARAIDEPGGESRVLNSLGNGYWRLDRLNESADCFRQALAILRTMGDLPSVAVVLNNLGAVLGEAGDVNAAATYLYEVLDIRRQLGDQLDESFALHNLGHLFHENDRYADALPLLELALEIRRGQKNRISVGITLHCLADTLLGLGRHDEADEAAHQALVIFDQEGDHYGRGSALHTLGRTRSAQGRREEAIDLLRQAIVEYHNLGNLRDEARANADLQAVHSRGGAGEPKLDPPAPASATVMPERRSRSRSDRDHPSK